jgi:hypothetical protein
MKKDQKVLILMLIVPLFLFGTGYAYAQQITSTYIAYSLTSVPAGQTSTTNAYCNSGDFATGGDTAFGPGLISGGGAPIPIVQGATPVGWTGTAENPTGSPGSLVAYAICMSPTTVAGIGVPEFGFTYIIMILGVAVYAILTKMGKLQLKLVPQK